VLSSAPDRDDRVPDRLSSAPDHGRVPDRFSSTPDHDGRVPDRFSSVPDHDGRVPDRFSSAPDHDRLSSPRLDGRGLAPVDRLSSVGESGRGFVPVGRLSSEALIVRGFFAGPGLSSVDCRAGRTSGSRTVDSVIADRSSADTSCCTPNLPPSRRPARTKRCVHVTNARTAASVTGSGDGQNRPNDLSVPSPPDQPPWYLFCAHSTPSSTTASTTSAARSTRKSSSLRSAPAKSDST
jgi:hypothetical protein